MQPSDQDELRRQAQKVLTRRIEVDTERREPPARPRQQPPPRRTQLPPAQSDGQRQRQKARDAEKLRELNERRQREQQRARPVVEVNIQEPDARLDRAERRRVADDVSSSSVHRDIHRGTHEGVHQSRHQDIHAGAYARADAARRRNQIYRDLFDPEALKRAIVLAEIIGKPVALREHEGNTT
jgi:hypothetical protein